MEEQLSVSDDHHGIKNILEQLRGKVLKSNIPSVNMEKFGATTSVITDTEIRDATIVTAGHFGGESLRPRKHERDDAHEDEQRRKQLKLHHGKETVVFAPSMDELLPDFLRISNVRGSSDDFDSYSSTNIHDFESNLRSDGLGLGLGLASGLGSEVPAPNVVQNPAEASDDEDDVVWDENDES